MKKPSNKIIEVSSCKISNPDSGELKSKFDRSTFDGRSLSLKQFKLSKRVCNFLILKNKH